MKSGLLSLSKKNARIIFQEPKEKNTTLAYDTKRIEELEARILEKKEEIESLQNEVKKEMIADFYERHGLKEGQHFFFEGKECVGVDMAVGSNLLKTFPLTASGEPSKRGLIIYNEKSIKPV